MNETKKLENSNPNGDHYLVNFFGCNARKIDSITFWKKILPGAVRNTNIKILHYYFYKFKPQGVTAFLLLSASHISIHSWPEYGYVACDVFACGKKNDTDAIIKYLSKNIPHKKIEIKKHRRGFKFC